jgi:hypothetical protein
MTKPSCLPPLFASAILVPHFLSQMIFPSCPSFETIEEVAIEKVKRGTPGNFSQSESIIQANPEKRGDVPALMRWLRYILKDGLQNMGKLRVPSTGINN